MKIKQIIMKNYINNMTPPESMSISLNFQYILPDEILDSDEVSIRIIQRVINALVPISDSIGSVIIRADKLLYSQYVGTQHETCLQNVIRMSDDWTYLRCNPEFNIYALPLDCVFTVLISGNLAGKIDSIFEKLLPNLDHPVLFAMELRTNIQAHVHYFLSPLNSFGILNKDGTLELSFDVIEYDPELLAELTQCGVSIGLSDAATAKCLKLLGE